MRIAMVSPDKKSEKAISLISSNIVKGVKNRGTEIDLITYKAGSPTSFFNIFKKLKKYDVIHVQHEYNLLGYFGIPFYIVFLALGLLNRKIVVTMHTPAPIKGQQKGSFLKNFLRKVLYFSQNKIAAMASDAILVNENFFKDTLARDYGIKKENIYVISQPVPEPLLIDKKKARKLLNLSGKVYLIIGNVTSDSGADIVIRQADKIGETILFVTNPRGVNTRNSKKVQDYINQNKKIVQEKNLGQFVRFDLREIDNKLWWTYFSAADLVLQAYRGGIRSGVFSDAMVAKVPVVSSNIKFFKEMYSKHKSLIVVENEEDYPKAIKTAMNPKNYKKMKEECGRYAKENSLLSISKQYVAFYEKILNSK